MGTLLNRFITTDWHTTTKYRLAEDEVHIYRIWIDEQLSDLDRYKALLNPGELQTASRFFREIDREKFVVRRAMQRTILGRYLDADPREILFALGENKKPSIEGAAIHFNISHSSNGALLAVAKSAVGVDIEYTDRKFRFAEILPGYFSPDEIDWINNGDDPSANFYTIWTRKEAYLKATGQGIDDHLILMPGLDGSHNLPKHLWGNDKNWTLSNFAVAANYLGAVAVEQHIDTIRFFNS